MLQQTPHRRIGVSIRWFPKDLQLSHKTVRWGESRQRGIKVVVLLFTCRFALAVSQPSPCQSRVRVLSAGVITFERCTAKKPTRARRVGEGSGIGSALLSLRVPQGLLCTERRQYVTVTDGGSSVPCRRGLCRRMPAGFTGLGVPGWCPAPQSAGRRCRLPQQQINASPPSLHPTRPSHHPGGRRGRGPGGCVCTRWCGDAGAHHLLPAPAGGEEDGWGAASHSSPSQAACGRAWAQQKGKQLKTTAICKSNQVESLKLLEILFFF